ncbi:MAG: sulfatase [Planctomycetes bacterium]|nr:sulfatase [Planctomycetota bacterium]
MNPPPVFRPVFLLIAAGLLTAPRPSVACSSVEPARPPNVLMIVGDDMGWTDYGFMGHPSVQTPHLDKLAGEGAVFPSGYVPTSLCRASLATLLTGLYAHEHKICCNDPPKGVDRSAMLPFLRDAPTVPRLLEAKGYRSLQTGKFWEGHYSNGGFTHGMTTKGRHGEEGLDIGRKTLEPVYEFIAECGESPWFVWYAPMMPHQPHNPPERILKKYVVEGRDQRLAKYWAMCEWFDQTCGELLHWLDAKGLTEHTLVLYVADNGWVQATGPAKPNEQFLTRSKNTPYDAGVRTPVILKWPGNVKPGPHEDLVSTVDLAPTILSACGIKPPARMSGLSLLDVSTGKGKLPRGEVFGEIYLHDCVEVGKPSLSLTHRWVREGDWKLIVPTKADAQLELYHLRRDPHEQNDLTATEPDRVGRLRELLNRWWTGKDEHLRAERMIE